MITTEYLLVLAFRKLATELQDVDEDVAYTLRRGAERIEELQDAVSQLRHGQELLRDVTTVARAMSNELTRLTRDNQSPLSLPWHLVPRVLEAEAHLAVGETEEEVQS